MPTYPITASELLEVAEATLHVSTLGAEWTTLANQAIPMAYAEIQGALQLKGYTPGDIDAWDSLTAFTTQQALWRLSELATNLTDWKADPSVRVKDQREYFEGDTFVLVVDGTAVAPIGTGPVGGIGYGEIDAGTTDRIAASLAWYGRLSPYYGRYPYPWGC